jgi:hypothetical protein
MESTLTRLELVANCTNQRWFGCGLLHYEQAFDFSLKLSEVETVSEPSHLRKVRALRSTSFSGSR